MENTILLGSFILITLVSFVLGAIGMARYINRKPRTIEKPATKDTIYASHVMNTAAMIYCNYSDSRIIRPGATRTHKQERYGEAIQEALNLVGSAYKYFDLVDSNEKVEPKKPAVIQKADVKDIKIN